MLAFLRLSIDCERRCLTLSNSVCIFCICLRIIRRSVSTCVSPGPRVPIPPPSRSKCDHCTTSLGRRYWCCASSTCNCPSCVRAWRPNTSKIRAVRSMTFICRADSRFRCWVGVSSSSNITTSACFSLACSCNSSNLPLPTYVEVNLSAR